MENELDAARERILLLERAIRDILYRENNGAIYCAWQGYIDLGDKAPILKEVVR